MTDTAIARSFTDEWNAWRADRDRVLAEPYGILSITSINFLGLDPVTIDGIPGRWQVDDGPVVDLDEGEELFEGDNRLTGRFQLGPLAGPPRQLRTGDVRIEVFRKDGWDIVRPRDPRSSILAAFTGTPAYEPDPRWRIEGRWLPYEAPKSVQIDSVQPRLGGPVGALGEVEFELEGRTHRLIALPAHGAPGSVALLFRDRTSGVTTYAASRELQVALPSHGDTVIVDFNRAYNKNCAYTDFAVCPLPPAGNVLDVAIEAGEKTPPRG